MTRAPSALAIAAHPDDIEFMMAGTLRLLHEAGWDGTVTLEIFSRERAHLVTSRRLWLEWWSEARR